MAYHGARTVQYAYPWSTGCTHTVLFDTSIGTHNYRVSLFLAATLPNTFHRLYYCDGSQLNFTCLLYLFTPYNNAVFFDNSGCMLCLGRANYFRFNHPTQALKLKESFDGATSSEKLPEMPGSHTKSHSKFRLCFHLFIFSQS